MVTNLNNFVNESLRSSFSLNVKLCGLYGTTLEQIIKGGFIDSDIINYVNLADFNFNFLLICFD